MSEFQVSYNGVKVNIPRQRVSALASLLVSSPFGRCKR
jgi:hypothetical protein